MVGQAPRYHVLAILGVPTDDAMDMGMFSVPIIDSDPVKTRAEVTLSVGYQVASEGFDIGKSGCVFRRNDEPVIMRILLAALRECAMIETAARGAEHPCPFAILGHAVATQIGEMGGNRCAHHAVTDDTGLDHGAARSAGHFPALR